MEISYRREIKHNYLVVIPDRGEAAGYEAKMLAGNEIRGIMHMHIRYQDGSPSYYYDITSRQPLSRLLETRFITRDEICQILIELHVALLGMEEYLLSDGGILLNPDIVYVEPELFHISLCVVPGHRGSFPEQLSRLLQYLLKCVNHKDRECVVLAYGMYQESLKDNYGIEDILKFISPDREMKGRDGSGDRSGLGSGQDAWVEEGGREKEKGQEDKGGLIGDSGQGERNISCEGACEGAGGGLAGGGSGRRGGLVAKQAGAWMAAAILVPGVLWLLKGMNAVRELGFVLICLDGGLLFALALTDLVLWKAGRLEDGGQKAMGQRQQACGTGKDSWEILYEDDEDSDPLSGQYNRVGEADEDGEACNRNVRGGFAGASLRDGNEEIFQTTLLAGSQPDRGEMRRLTSIEGAEEDIIISYYPFVIGKNRNLADYVLLKDTVSRFHLRIDEDGGSYTVTDLNSTNGTRVRGRLLDANETAVIENGDEIMIADIGYIFS